MKDRSTLCAHVSLTDVPLRYAEVSRVLGAKCKARSAHGYYSDKMASEGNGISRALSRLWNGNGGSEEESPVEWFKLVRSVHTAGVTASWHRHTCVRLSVQRADSTDIAAW